MKQRDTGLIALLIAMSLLIVIQVAAALVYLSYSLTLWVPMTSLQSTVATVCLAAYLLAPIVALITYNKINPRVKGQRRPFWHFLIICAVMLWPLTWYAAAEGPRIVHNYFAEKQSDEARVKWIAANEAYQKTKPPECLKNSTILYEQQMRLIDWTNIINKYGNGDDKRYMHEHVDKITTTTKQCQSEEITEQEEKSIVAGYINTIKQRAQVILTSVPESTLQTYERKLLP